MGINLMGMGDGNARGCMHACIMEGEPADLCYYYNMFMLLVAQFLVASLENPDAYSVNEQFSLM